MQDLTLVGVSDDGEHLMLSGADGQRFRVRVDEPLRAAVRRDRARLGQLRIELDGRLRPREIQARIRAGQTAQEVAEAAQLPLEHVRRFEGPVLAEREFVARQARGVRVRRSGLGSQPSLGELVGERLSRREVDEDAADWDAYRREDGQWVVTLAFPAGGRTRTASWSFDPQLRHVVPLDDESRWLTEDEPSEPVSGPAGARRLAPVPDPLRGGRGRDLVFDVEADGAVRPTAQAPLPAAGTPLPEAPVPTSAPAAAHRSTVDLLDSLRERRGRRPRPAESQSPTADTRPAEPHPAEPHPADHRPSEHRPAEPSPAASAAPAAEPATAVENGPAAVVRLPADAQDEVDLAAAEPPAEIDVSRAEPLPQVAGDRPGRKNRRASVPSWDDIVFGSRRE